MRISRTGREHSPGSGLVQFTSAVRYPVYLANVDNYSGPPDPLG